MGINQPNAQSRSESALISTPDQRLRVFVSSTLGELASEREVARGAIETLRLTPVMFELGARPHPPADLYRSYLEQSDVFVGIYWESYGWVAPEEEISGLEDEFGLSESLPRLIYVKEPAPGREERLTSMLDRLIEGGSASFRQFHTVDELQDLLLDDLAVLVTERFYASSTPDLNEGTMTFFFADLEGSTPMVRRLGDEYRVLLRDYHAIVQAAVSGHHGRTAATEGDGFFCVFGSPIDAVAAARQVLVEMSGRSWPGGERPRCRIGIHTGTATRTMEGYVGLDVHRASRIGSAANGGQILVSAPTRALLDEHVTASGWSMADLGEFNLEGIGREERLFRLDIPELDLVDSAPRARARPRLTLPNAPRPIVGRVADLAGASEMLRREAVRLVTITGPGGTGKTRLAVEIASRLDADYPDGVVFVDLSAVRDRDRFLPTVGRALGVRESSERDVIEGLQSVIGDSKMLIVLDNLEQLLDVAPEVGQLLEFLTGIDILATSRSPLRLSWENEYPLPPLPVPGPSADLETIAESDAVALFVERAKVVRPGFDIDAPNSAAIAEITRRLDGLPLAIELAAARLRLFPVEVLLQRLDDRLSLLDKGASDAPERHRTLRAAIQWSHDLLDDSEKAVFRRLSVFTGGWTLDAALEVCASEELTPSMVLDVLDELVAKSLVIFSFDEHGRTRFRMLETLREYSLERLVQAGEEDVTRTRHLHWCHTLASQVMDVLSTPAFPSFLDEMEIERANLRTAVMWAGTARVGLEEALTICGYLPLFWDTRGYVTEGVELTRRLVAVTEGNSTGRGMALAALGWIEMLGGEPDRSEDALSAAEQMFRHLDNPNWLGRTLAMHGMTTYNRDDLDTAERQFDEAIVLTKAHGLDWLAEAWCAYGLAHIALARGDFERCQSLLEMALGYSRDNGLTWGVGHTQLSLGILSFMRGDMDEALRRLSESAKVRQELRDSRGICDCLGTIALLASFRGENEFAAQMLGAAEMAREASGHQVVPWLRPLLEQAQMSVQQALEDDYETRLAEGRSLSTDRAIEMILERFYSPEKVGIPTP